MKCSPVEIACRRDILVAELAGGLGGFLHAGLEEVVFLVGSLIQ